MKLRDDINEEGIPVTWFKCDSCDTEYTICPAIKEGQEAGWNNCMTHECSSYDPSRDAEVLFLSDKELRSHNKLYDMKMLKKRAVFRRGEIDLKDNT